MLGDPRSGSKVWEALDREIGKPGENRGQIVAYWEFQSAAAFHAREYRGNLGSRLGAAYAYPLLPTQSHGTHRVFRKVIGTDPESATIPDEDLQPIALGVAEQEQVPAKRLTRQSIPDQAVQPLEPLALLRCTTKAPLCAVHRYA